MANQVTNHTIGFIPLEQLHFDPENPRLPNTIDGSTESEVLEWMLRYGRLPELMASIGEQGFFVAEPLLAVPRVSGGFWVVEGNRRLAAAKLLRDPSAATTRQTAVRDIAQTAKHRPAELPVLVYSARSEVLDYLGFRHITGVHEWNPLEKARYLEQMRKALELEGVPSSEMHRRLAKLIGSRSDYVGRLLLGLKVREKISNEVLPQSDLRVREEDISFSVLTTGLNYSAISTFLGLGDVEEIESVNSQRLTELTKWMFEKNPENQTRLGESRNLSLLAKVVGHPEALAEFRKGLNLGEAAVHADGAGTVMRSALTEAKTYLKAAHSAFPTVVELTEEDVDLSRTVQVAAQRLFKQIREEYETTLEDGIVDSE